MLEQQEQDNLIESPISEDAFDDNQVATKYQTMGEAEYWQTELVASEKEHKKFTEKGHRIVKRFTDERDGADAGKSYYNLLASNTEIKMSALYARTPLPEVSRRFTDATDQVSRVASNLLQRNISIELETENFDTKFKQICLDRLLPGLGVGWVRLESDGQFETSIIDYVAWDDFRWAPCKVWTDCRWVARKVPMNKEAVVARFGDTCPEEILRDLAFSKGSEVKIENDASPKNQTVATIDVYEIWDKERGLVFWVSEGVEVPLDVSEDTNQFPDFFPTPLPPLGRFTNANTNPIPDFQLLEDQYNELDSLNNRCTNLVRALQLKWVYDNSRKELKDLYNNTGELQGVGVTDWAEFASEKGGLRNSIEFAPLDEIAATYGKLIQARESVKQQIFEMEGISDILRGASMPYETASATAAKGAASSSRMGVSQHLAADYIARLLRLKSHLIMKFYSPETIMARVGELQKADQQYIGPAIEMLKNSHISNFRLLVSVDSIQLPNWNQEKAERSEFINSLTGLMGQMIPAVKQTPELAPLAMALIKFGVAGFKGAQQIEGVIDQALDQILAQQAQAQQNKPPSEAEMKMQMHREAQQTRLQVAQTQAQTTAAVEGQKAQLKGAELQLKQAELGIQATKLSHEEAHWQDTNDSSNIDRAHKVAMDLTGGQG